MSQPTDPTTTQGLASCAALQDGVRMPWLGLGTWRATDAEASAAVAAALEMGYRHIDTAAAYDNEQGVGRAVAEHAVERDEVFVTTKIANPQIKRGAKATRDALADSLDRLGFEAVDLVLLHWPVSGRLEAWKALEEAYERGLTRAIGVSNFMIEHLEELLGVAQVKPMVNQVEFHPYLVQPALLRFCREHGIQHEAWSPLMQGRVGEVAELARIGEPHAKTPAQVAIRWAIQHGSVTIPKSVRPERLAENADVFDFELTEAEMQAIDALDRDTRFGPDPYTFDG